MRLWLHAHRPSPLPAGRSQEPMGLSARRHALPRRAASPPAAERTRRVAIRIDSASTKDLRHGAPRPRSRQRGVPARGRAFSGRRHRACPHLRNLTRQLCGAYMPVLRGACPVAHCVAAALARLWHRGWCFPRRCRLVQLRPPAQRTAPAGTWCRSCSCNLART